MSMIQSGYAYASGSIAVMPRSNYLPDYNAMFRLEAMASHEERAFLNALWANPQDEAARQQYIDFLLEKFRPWAAERVRRGFTPGFGP